MLLTLGLLCLGTAWAGNFNNELLEDPTIMKCSVDQISVQFKFKNAFAGQFFTLDKDEDGKKQCVYDESTNAFPSYKKEIVVDFVNTENCPFEQEHVTPEGCKINDDGTKSDCQKTAYTFTIYLRFWAADSHEVGVHTKIDRAFTFACTPNDETKEHSLSLTVVDVTPETIVHNFTTNPTCSYCITDIDPSTGLPTNPVCPHDDGPVGFDKKLFHEVHCENDPHWDGAYCLEVVQCKASDLSMRTINSLTSKNSVTIIENDCTTDAKLISSFDYGESNLWGVAASHPFHIGHPNATRQDSVTVYFYCELRLYPSDKDDQCSERPTCDSDGRKKRSARAMAGHTLHVKNHFRFKPSVYDRYLAL